MDKLDSVFAAPCPECHALPTESCKSNSGYYAGGYTHQARMHTFNGINTGIEMGFTQAIEILTSAKAQFTHELKAAG